MNFKRVGHNFIIGMVTVGVYISSTGSIVLAAPVNSKNDLLDKSLIQIENFEEDFVIKKGSNYNANWLTQDEVSNYLNNNLSDFQKYNYRTYRIRESISRVIFSMIYNNTLDDVNYANDYINNSIKALSGDDIEKLEGAYFKILNDLHYKEWSKGTNDELLKIKERNVREAIDNGGVVCEGYAYITDLYLKNMGYNSFLFSGVTNGENHLWNGIEIDGSIYFIDSTWGDNINPHIQERYFLIGYDELSKSHNFDEKSLKYKDKFSNKNYKKEYTNWLYKEVLELNTNYLELIEETNTIIENEINNEKTDKLINSLKNNQSKVLNILNISNFDEILNISKNNLNILTNNKNTILKNDLINYINTHNWDNVLFSHEYDELNQLSKDISNITTLKEYQIIKGQLYDLGKTKDIKEEEEKITNNILDQIKNTDNIDDLNLIDIPKNLSQKHRDKINIIIDKQKEIIKNKEINKEIEEGVIGDYEDWVNNEDNYNKTITDYYNNKLIEQGIIDDYQDWIQSEEDYYKVITDYYNNKLMEQGIIDDYQDWIQNEEDYYKVITDYYNNKLMEQGIIDNYQDWIQSEEDYYKVIEDYYNNLKDPDKPIEGEDEDKPNIEDQYSYEAKYYAQLIKEQIDLVPLLNIEQHFINDSRLTKKEMNYLKKTIEEVRNSIYKRDANSFNLYLELMKSDFDYNLSKQLIDYYYNGMPKQSHNYVDYELFDDIVYIVKIMPGKQLEDEINRFLKKSGYSKKDINNINAYIEYYNNLEYKDDFDLNLLDKLKALKKTIDINENNKYNDYNIEIPYEDLYYADQINVLKEVNKRQNLRFNITYINWYFQKGLNIDKELVNTFEKTMNKKNINFNHIIEINEFLDNIIYKILKEEEITNLINSYKDLIINEIDIVPLKNIVSHYTNEPKLSDENKLYLDSLVEEKKAEIFQRDAKSYNWYLNKVYTDFDYELSKQLINYYYNGMYKESYQYVDMDLFNTIKNKIELHEGYINKEEYNNFLTDISDDLFSNINELNLIDEVNNLEYLRFNLEYINYKYNKDLLINKKFINEFINIKNKNIKDIKDIKDINKLLDKTQKEIDKKEFKNIKKGNTNKIVNQFELLGKKEELENKLNYERNSKNRKAILKELNKINNQLN